MAGNAAGPRDRSVANRPALYNGQKLRAWPVRPELQWRSDHEVGDYEGAENLMSVIGNQSNSFSEQLRAFRERFVLGWGG